MIKLFQFPTSWGLPNTSPFCMKLDTYLRMTKLPYKTKTVMDPRKAPKGKLPFIEDDGVFIADSGMVIDYLNKKYSISLDANLSSMQKAQALAMQRLMEEHLYWCIVYSRWLDENNWPMVKQAFFGKVPLLMRNFITRSVRKQMTRDLYGHGISRHSAAELYQLGVNDLQALHIILGANKFFMGDEPTSIDASAYAFLANILHSPVKSPMADYVKAQQSFVDYCARMKELYY